MEQNFHWIHWIQGIQRIWEITGSMNWVQYKDLLSCLCLCGTAVSSLSFTQEIMGSNPAISLFDYNFFCHWVQRTQWNHLVKTPMSEIEHLKRPNIHGLTFYSIIMKYRWNSWNYCTLKLSAKKLFNQYKRPSLNYLFFMMIIFKTVTQK